MNLRRIFHQLRPHLSLNNGVFLVAFLIAASWVWSTIDAVQRNFKLQQQVDFLQQEVAVSELENKTFVFQNKYYKSNEYIELSARERLNKASPGEKLLILPPNKARPSEDKTVVAAEVPITSRSNFAQWMYFLFGKKS